MKSLKNLKNLTDKEALRNAKVVEVQTNSSGNITHIVLKRGKYTSTVISLQSGTIGVSQV